MAYSGGGLWLIFPSHLLATNACNFDSPCPSTLDSCLTRYKNTNTVVLQPFSGSSQNVGQIVRWTNSQPGASVTDVAAAWMDNDINQANSSLCADQTINQFGLWSGQDVNLGDLRPNQTLLIMQTLHSTQNDHKRTVRVSRVNVSISDVGTDCGDGGRVTYLNQVEYTAPNFDLVDGDSGAPVLTNQGQFVAMHQWSTSNGSTGGGIAGAYIKSVLGFSKWYGTATFPNNPLICQ
jgi:hypothetical protein